MFHLDCISIAGFQRYNSDQTCCNFSLKTATSRIRNRNTANTHAVYKLYILWMHRWLGTGRWSQILCGRHELLPRPNLTAWMIAHSHRLAWCGRKNMHPIHEQVRHWFIRLAQNSITITIVKIVLLILIIKTQMHTVLTFYYFVSVSIIVLAEAFTHNPLTHMQTPYTYHFLMN